MAKNIEPKLKKIGDYLKLDEDTIFEVPEYQRAYSWDIARCDKLWQDIVDYIASDNKDRYFFGTIIINCQENDTRYVLIDGQQRTTSFLLLLKALLININNAIEKTSADPDSIPLCNGLKERRRKIMGILYKAEAEVISDIPDQDMDCALYTATHILENRSINERYKNELYSILSATSFIEAEQTAIKIPYKQKDNKYTNFFRNFKFFYNKAYELYPSQLNSIAKCIVENCEVIEIKSWQVDQAITMFNSLNSDGMPLYDSDIISAQFFAEAESIKEGHEFSTRWKSLLDTIDTPNTREIISIDSILMQHMYYVRAFKREIINESGTANVTMPGLRRYYLSGDGNNSRDTIIRHPIESCTQMLNIAKIWNAVVDNPALKVLLKFNENAKLFLGSYFYRFGNAIPSVQEVTSVSETMLRLFAVLELVDAGYSSSKFKSFLFAEEIKLIDPTIPLDEIKNDFSMHITRNWTRDRLMPEIMDNDNNSLVYLNEYLFAKENGITFSLGDKYDIEHIMPASGRNQQEIQKDAGIKDGDEFKDFVNKLGNKILLEVKINRAIGNEWFRTKVSTKLTDKTGYIDSAYPLAKALVGKYKGIDKPYWKKGDIEEATKKACSRILNFIFN